MAVISMASPKGGVGKTTSALVLAGELAQAGSTVTLIDADPNEPLTMWEQIRGPREGITIRNRIDEENIIDEIEAARAESKMVIVDLEGTAGVLVTYAITRSDLVLVPLQGSQLDAVQATRAVRLIRQNEKALERDIPYALVFTRTSAAIQGRTFKHVAAELETARVDICPTQLIEREAFRALFSLGGTLHDLRDADVSNLDMAKENAEQFAFDVLQRLPKKTKSRARKAGRAA